MNFDPNQKGMHPSDKKNLIIFVLASLLLWFAFEHFVIGPRVEESKKQQAILETTAPQSKVAADASDKIIPRDQKLAEVQRVKISSSELIGSIPTVGNRLDDISLKNYFVELNNTTPVILMSPSETENSHYAENGWLPVTSDTKVPDSNTVWSVKGNNQLTPSSPVTLTWSNGNGLAFERTYTLDEHFMLTLTQKVMNNGKATVELYPYSSLTRKGIPHGHGKGIGYEGPMGYIADDLHEISYSDLDDDGNQKFTALTGWIGFGEKYWLSALLPEQQKQNSFSFQIVPDKTNPEKNIYQVDIRGEKQTIETGKSAEETVNIFVGAKKIALLDEYEDKLNIKHFDLAVDFGVLYFLTKPLYFFTYPI